MDAPKHHLIHFYRPFFYSFSTGNRRARMPCFALWGFSAPQSLGSSPCRLGQVAGGGALPRGPAGSGRVPGGGEEAAGGPREGVLEDLPYCRRLLEATYFYIISGIRGPRMPGRRGSWRSTVPWVRGGEEAAWGLWREAFWVVPLCDGLFGHVI
jgi:hypothetical protein